MGCLRHQVAFRPNDAVYWLSGRRSNGAYGIRLGRRFRDAIEALSTILPGRDWVMDVSSSTIRGAYLE